MRWLARWARRMADRIDPDGVPRWTGLSYTYESGRGMVMHGEWGCYRAGDDGQGTPLYRIDREGERAYAEAVPKAESDWSQTRPSPTTDQRGEDMTITEQRELDRVARDATHELLAERVTRGVALLDREMPDWWQVDREVNGYRVLTVIDVDRVDMGDGGWCVFGQLENPGMECAYRDMARRVFGSDLDARMAAAIQHGVYAIAGWHFDILTDLWREVIEKRRANA